MNRHLPKLLTIILTLTVFISIASADPTLLKISFIDLGQADCTLIQAPNGNNMLIDAGNSESYNRITTYLDSQKITKLNVVIATNANEEHIGSMGKIIQHFNIGKIYIPKVFANSKPYTDLLSIIDEKGVMVSTTGAGVSMGLDPAVKFEMLAPNNTKYNNTNDYSTVIKLTYGKTVFLLASDAGWVSEREMLRKKYDLKANVLKVGNHGSNGATTGSFLKVVCPQYAIISVEAQNNLGYPGQSTLNRLILAGTSIYRTDQYGTIMITSDGKGLKLRTEK